MTAPLRIGIAGAGMIATTGSGVLPGIGPLAGRIDIRAIASPTLSRTEAVARTFAIPHVYQNVEDMLRDVELDAVVNLTPIPQHGEISKAILSAGNHLVTEKPLAATVAEADELIEMAASAGLTIVSSPPRMREPARARARELVRDGAIGQIAFARVRSSHAGPAWRAWPADPSWFYARGAGPLLDMGVYGIQEITGILGPAIAVTAVSARTTPTRTVAGGPFAGLVVPVEVDDNTHLMLHFENGAFATVDSTFNVRASRAPAVEIYGLGGTIALHDQDPSRPPIEIFTLDTEGVGGHWADARDAGYDQRQADVSALGRAILIEELLRCLDEGRVPVLSAEHARHTLEIMLAAVDSAESGRTVPLRTAF